MTEPKSKYTPEYKILTGPTFSNLEDEVNAHIVSGWQPYMHPVFHADDVEAFWYQAVLYVPPDPVAEAQRQAVMQQLRAQGATGIVTP